jgi:excisionase family DNA binding protein
VTLAGELVDLIAADPAALERLRELVAMTDHAPSSSAPAYTVASLAVELGRSERSIRAAIARGELQAVKRGRGWVVSADAVADWARAPDMNKRAYSSRPVRRRSGAGAMRRGLDQQRGPVTR